MAKEKVYYAGFVNGHIDTTDEVQGSTVLSIFSRRKDAKAAYSDVRRVRVVEAEK